MEYLMYYIRFASTLYRIFSFIRDIGLEVFIYFFIYLFVYSFIYCCVLSLSGFGSKVMLAS